METITLAGGCFWCLEAAFAEVEGVEAVESGYSNGHVERPSYEQVCAGDSGHAEVVQLRFDPDRLPLRAVLEIFFSLHDPTTLNRQGHDIGHQYRSGIYWHDQAQLEQIQAVRSEIDKALGGRVVTEVQPLHNYHRAEEHHQRYFACHPNQGYCAAVIAPKLQELRRAHRARLRPGA